MAPTIVAETKLNAGAQLKFIPYLIVRTHVPSISRVRTNATKNAYKTLIIAVLKYFLKFGWI